MSMLKWSTPLDELSEMNLLRRELDHLFTPVSGQTALNPPIDVAESEGYYRVRMSLPGLPTQNVGEHVQLEATPKTLNISGEVHAPEPQPGEKTLFSQVRHGKFSKQLSFPDGIDAETIEASYEAGILQITLPKSSVARKRNIEIQVK